MMSMRRPSSGDSQRISVSGAMVQGALTAKGPWAFVDGDGKVINREGGRAYSSVCICENTQNCSLKGWILGHVNYISILKKRRK